MASNSFASPKRRMMKTSAMPNGGRLFYEEENRILKILLGEQLLRKKKKPRNENPAFRLKKKNRKSSEKAIDCTAFLFFGIVYCVDNASDAGNHGK